MQHSLFLFYDQSRVGNCKFFVFIGDPTARLSSGCLCNTVLLVQGGVSTFFFPSSSWCWNSASNLIPSEVLVPSVVVY